MENSVKTNVCLVCNAKIETMCFKGTGACHHYHLEQLQGKK